MKNIYIPVNWHRFSPVAPMGPGEPEGPGSPCGPVSPGNCKQFRQLTKLVITYRLNYLFFYLQITNVEVMYIMYRIKVT